MPRKKLYRTREQQRLANNAKAKRWRDKNVEFLKRQREERKREEEELRAQELREKRQRAKGREKVTNEAKELEIDAQLIRPHLKEAERLYNDFRQKIPNNVHYLEHLYEKYTTPQPRFGYRHHSYLQDASKPLCKLQDSLAEASHAILNVAGPWEEWRRVEDMRAEIRDLVAWIDDMLASAITGLPELQHAYQTRQLRFRQYYSS
ncbi:hypothetical protein V5O48_018581 [Marasmius crinis-equi]|uniref:Uncharacterized protein n=1 Tax=Marasmius crinis-equi TaxID=585013 RepID=A0ABR3EKS7_9AGAR